MFTFAVQILGIIFSHFKGVDGDDIFFKPSRLPILLVVPASLKTAWWEMFAKHSKGLHVTELQSGKPEAFPFTITKRMVIMTSYELIASIAKNSNSNDDGHPLMNVQFGMMCLDEAHYVKNVTARGTACAMIKRQFTLLSTGIVVFVVAIFLLLLLL